MQPQRQTQIMATAIMKKAKPVIIALFRLLRKMINIKETLIAPEACPTMIAWREMEIRRVQVLQILVLRSSVHMPTIKRDIIQNYTCIRMLMLTFPSQNNTYTHTHT